MAYIEKDDFATWVYFIQNRNGDIKESTTRVHSNPAMAICLAVLQAKKEMGK